MWNFDKVTKHLNSKGIPFEEVEFSDTAISARLADTSLKGNYAPANAIKTLLVKGKTGVVAVILKGEDKIDSEKLKALIGKWSVVTTGELETDFGLIPGGINPFVLDVPVFVDEQVLTLKVLSMGAGSVSKGINMKTEDFANNLKFKTASVRKES